MKRGKRMRMTYFTCDPKGRFRFGWREFKRLLNLMEIQSHICPSGMRLSVRFSRIKEGGG